MRKKLATEEGQRKKFTAIFSRIGKKTNYRGYMEETILLTDIVDLETNSVVTEHVWFTFTKGFQDSRMKTGDRIQFEARIKKYLKGYVNRGLGFKKRQVDYRLSNPTKITVVETSSTGSGTRDLE